MSAHDEIEARWILPKDVLGLIPAYAEVWRYMQVYLGDKDEAERRIRWKRNPLNLASIFTYEEKRPTEQSQRRRESEPVIITQEQYMELLVMEADSDCSPIRKFRHSFRYLDSDDERTAEVDFYFGPLMGLVTAEVEVPTIEALETVSLPEIFGDRFYRLNGGFSNRDLARSGITAELQNIIDSL